MNIEFIDYNNYKGNKIRNFHSTTFPKDISLRVGDTIFLTDFNKFLVKGSLCYPENVELYTEIEDLDHHVYVITNIFHRYNEVTGYVMLVQITED